MNNQFDLAEKFMLAGCAILVCKMYGGQYLRGRSGDNPALQRIRLAITLVASGSILYIGYWTVWRTIDIIGYRETANYLLTIAPIFTAPAAAITCTGYALHHYEWFSKPNMLGRHWWKYFLAYGITVYLFGALFSALTDPSGVLTDRLDAAEQISRIFFAFPTAIIYGYRLWRYRDVDSPGLRLIFCGVILVALGVAGHSAAWTTIIMLTVDGSRLIVENTYFTTPPVVAYVVGYSFHFYTRASSPTVFGDRWARVTYLYITWLWLLGFSVGFALNLL